VPQRPDSDVTLLSSFAPEAFGEFYERHVTAVTVYVARRTREPDLIFDLVGETFARALELRRNHDPRKGPATTWLFGIARHLTTEAERRGQVPADARRRLGMEPFGLDDEALARVRERSRTDFIESLKHLPESQKMTIVRRVMGELEYPPIGPHVRCSDQLTPPPPPRRFAGLRR
jgi:RNA polymerase sigma-70 factor (ECF subfamily)